MQDIELNYLEKKPQPYKDIYLRLMACMIGTHILIVYGETKSTFEILLTQEYYLAFIGSFLIAFLLFSAIRAINIRLDRRFEWTAQPFHRAGLQAFFSLILPAFGAFLLAALYFRVRGVNIFHTSYLRYDFQYIVLQLLLINGYYICYYFYSKWAQVHQAIAKLREQIIEQPQTAVRSTFQVAKGASNLMLPVEQIAYCYRKEESNYIRTIEGEDFYITQSLDEVQQQLPEPAFFRANRQLILNRDACQGFDLLTYGKLKALVSPPFDGDVVISQKRAVNFKKWMQDVSFSKVTEQASLL